MSDEDGPLMFHAGVGRRIRRGTWRDHERSTYDLCLEEIARERWEDASALAAYAIEEALEPHEVFRDWLPEIRDFIMARGTDERTLEADEQRVRDAVRWPDGSAFDADAGWHEFCDRIDRVCAACDAADAVAARENMEAARRAWLETHDRKCDWVQGLIGIAAAHHGEDCIGALWDRLMAPMFETYDKYDVDVASWDDSWETLMQVTAEALRAHLTGPERRGTVTYVEEPDRAGFRFEPCGSGGRNFDGTVFRETPLTTAKHDWAWNMKGVCLYCAHCCALSERNPIRRFGYPARVVEPPFRDGERVRDHCTWWIYKDPAAVPEEVYARTGNTKPDRLGGAARRGEDAGT
jgi:hypothetical protein